MPVKDYYKILELPPNAGDESVKRNFRKLALRFHPDTNKGNIHEDAWYREIQEAYEVLSNPAKKSKYLQERWLLKSKGIPFEESFPLTPEYIELRFRSMSNNVKQWDHFRLDHVSLQNQLLQLCNDETLDALGKYQDLSVNKRIIHHLLSCLEPLHFNYLAPLLVPLNKIGVHQPNVLNEINNWYRRRAKQYWWERKQGWVIGAVTILLCSLIALLTKGGA